MKTIDEKEKKLEVALRKLKNLELIKPSEIGELDLLKNQKNQLEIEKKDLQERYAHLQEENEKLKEKFDEFKKRDLEGKKRRRLFLKKLMN